MNNYSLLIRKRNSGRNSLRFISAVLVFTFLFQEVLYANPDLKPLKFDLFQKKDLSWARGTIPSLPESVALIEDAWRSEDRGQKAEDRKTLILIQDAHTNTSGQFNLSKTLDILLQKGERLKYIFVEAGLGDNSLSFFRKYGSPEERKKIAGAFLRDGELHGEEYLDLTSDHDFILWGVEDLSLYK